jgi:hypothetical protein
MKPAQATKTELALWLRSLKKGGRTAPRGALASLKRACTLLGVNLELDDKLIKAQTLCANSQVEDRAVPFSVKIWLLLEKEATSSNGFVKAIALAWILLILGVTRFAHLQRSKLIGETDLYMEFEATSGKEKREGARKPMRWCVPRITLNKGDVRDLVKKFLVVRGKAYNQSNFWLPDFGPNHCSIANACSMTKSRMSIHRFQRLTWELFRAKGVPEEQIQIYSTYSARRILPTVGDAIMMSPTERLNIGAWTDPTRKLDKAQKKLAMPDRYSDERMRSKARSKFKATLAVKMALKKMDKDTDHEWSAIFSAFPKLKDLEEVVRKRV